MDHLDHAASQLRSMADRLLAEGGRIDQLVSNQIDLSETNAAKLARSLTGAAERLRLLRCYATEHYPANPDEYPRWPKPQPHGLASTPRAMLPVNRKERYYTGTILPGIVGSDRFIHLDLLLRRCGLPDVDTSQLACLEFLTEYSLLESAWTPDEMRQFDTIGLAGDTPDVIIAGEDWLVVIEAKMFHRPSRADLDSQLIAQRPIVDRLARGLGIEPRRVKHGFLGPAGLEPPTGGDFALTWNDILDDYDGIADAYWCEALRRALAAYPERASKVGSNADAKVTGAELLAAFESGECPWGYVGRQGGLNGKVFESDVVTGAWATVSYQVREDEADPNNRNWMDIEAWAGKILGGHDE